MKKFMKFKIISLCFLCLAFFLMTGCTGILQLHERMVIQGIGIDLEESGYKVTIQALDFKNSAGENEPAIKVMELKGSSLIEALESAKKQSGLTPMYSQNLVVVVGKNLAVAGMNNFLDFFIRHYEARPNVKICVCDTEAADILSIKKENGTIQAKEISDIIPNNLNSDILHFVGRLKDETSDPYCAYLSVKKEDKEENKSEDKSENKTENKSDNNNEDKKEKQRENSDKEDENSKKILNLAGIAFFSDDKMVGSSSGKELLGLLATMGINDLGVFNINSEKIGKVSLDLQNVKSKINVNTKENKFYIDITLGAEALEITPNEGVRIGEIEQQEIEKQLNSEIKEICKQAIKNALNLNSDLFRFKKVILNYNPGYFKENQKKLKKSLSQYEIEINVKSSLSITGTEI